MSEDERKSEIQSQCWKTIFIAIALLAIGAVLGHLATVRCCQMTGRCGGYGMRACWDGGRLEGQREFGHRFGGGKKVCDKQGDWVECKGKMEKSKPGREHPKCSKKAGSLSEQKKGVCPMAEKKAEEKAEESKKD